MTVPTLENPNVGYLKRDWRLQNRWKPSERKKDNSYKYIKGLKSDEN